MTAMQTGSTGSIKISDMTINFAVKSLIGKDVNVIESFYGKIKNTAAAFAYKMVMRGRVAIEAVRTDAGRQLLDFSDI